MASDYVIRQFWASKIKKKNYAITVDKSVKDEWYRLLSSLDDSMELRQYLHIKKDETQEVSKYLDDFVQVSFTRRDGAIRKKLYEDGFTLNGVHYVKYKRTAGSARRGKCIFINEKYQAPLDEWSLCGLDPNKKIIQDTIVSFESYRALTLSGIKDSIKIDLNSIFLIDEDYKSTFIENVNKVTGNDRGTLDCEEAEIEITNNIWDGEGLLDESLFRSSGHSDKGMMLLRNKFFKCCVFNTKLQKWFKDKKVTMGDLKKVGVTHAKKITDIKMIITPSSLKFLKYGSFDEWLENAEENFGIVKFDMATPYFEGKRVRTSYTMLNTLDLNKEEVEELYAPAYQYVQNVRDKVDVFYYHLKRKRKTENANNSSNSYRFGLLIEMLKTYPDLFKNPLFADIRQNLTDGIREEYKHGQVLIPGHYGTIFGNGPEMLQALTGKYKGGSILKPNEVYCSGFAEGREIAGFRFPHITMGNLLLARNTKHEEFKYFNLTPQIICVTAVNNNIQQRLNGMDYDSDVMLMTEDKLIVEAVGRYYNTFLVPFNGEEEHKDTAKDSTTPKTAADVDSMINNNQVGRVVNFATMLNSLFWDQLHKDNFFDKQLYQEICKLAVLSGMEIDKAKHQYNVDAVKTMSEIKAELKEMERNVRRPEFTKTSTQRKKEIKEGTYNPMYSTMDLVIQSVDCHMLKKPRLGQQDFLSLIEKVVRPNGNDYKNANLVIDYIEEIAEKFQSSQRNVNGSEKEELGLLNSYRQAVLDSYKPFISVCIQSKKPVQILVKKLDEFIRISADDKKYSAAECSKASNMAWILLYYLWNDEQAVDDKGNVDPDKGAWLKRLMQHEEKKNRKTGLYICEPDDDVYVTLYGIPLAQRSPNASLDDTTDEDDDGLEDYNKYEEYAEEFDDLY